MKISSAEFVTSAPDFDSCPESDMSEFAFIGRSNVGKSSLINMLTGKDRLAKVSKTPGHTKLINFFSINKKWTLVDLPGYGFAKVTRQDKELFNQFVSDYIAQRKNLAGLFILVDSKIPPQTLDLEFIQWVVHYEIPFTLLFTKTDRTKPEIFKKNRTSFLKQLKDYCDGEPKIIACSSKNGKGRNDILHLIEQVLKAQNKAKA